METFVRYAKSPHKKTFDPVPRMTPLESFRALREFCRFRIAGSTGKHDVTIKRTKDTKNWEIITVQFLNFVSLRRCSGHASRSRGEMSVSILVAAFGTI